MRKPNYLQIKINTGRVQEEFMIPYDEFENSLCEISEICDATRRCKHFDSATKDFFNVLLFHLNLIEQRTNYLLKL